MRRRLKALDRQHGGRVLLRLSDRPGAKLWVRTEGLAEALKTDPDARDAELETLTTDLQLVQSRQLAIRGGLRKLRKDFERERRRQNRVNQLVAEQLQSTAELTAILSERGQ